MRKVAEAPVEFAPRAKPNFDPAELNSEGVGGTLADMFGIGTMGSQRAGRAVALQDAMGQEPDFRLKYPTLSALPLMLLGGVGGAAVDRVLGRDYGSSLGRVGPSVGLALDGLLRNQQIRNVNESFRQHSGPIRPVARKGNILGITAGGHGKGRAEGLEALVTGNPKTDPMIGSTLFQNAIRLTGLLDPSASTHAAGVAGALGLAGIQAYHKGKARGKIQNLINQEFGYAPSGAVPLFAKKNEGRQQEDSLREFQMMLAAAQAAGKKPSPELFQKMREERDRQKSAATGRVPTAQDTAMARQYLASGRAPSPWHRQNMPGLWHEYTALRNQRDANMHASNARTIAADAAAYGLKPETRNPWEQPSQSATENLARMQPARIPVTQTPAMPRPAVSPSQMAANSYDPARAGALPVQTASPAQLAAAQQNFEAFKARQAGGSAPAAPAAPAAVAALSQSPIGWERTTPPATLSQSTGGWARQSPSGASGWDRQTPTKSVVAPTPPVKPTTPNAPIQVQTPHQPAYAGVKGFRSWRKSETPSLLSQSATSSTLGGPVKSAKASKKKNPDVITAKRTSPPVHSWLDKMVFSQEEMGPPSPQDIAKWEKIVRHMKASAPTELQDTKVFSGPVPSSHFVKQIEKGKHNDTTLEYVTGDRDELAQAYAAVPSEFFGQFDASYHPHANSVILNERSPGALIHEMGHAADMQRRDGESNFSRWLRWQLKPTLLQETSAWNKGEKHYDRGFRTSEDLRKKKERDDYVDNMVSIRGRKYPALGTYFGGAAGSVLGAALPFAALAGGLIPREQRGITAPLAILGAGAGGVAGALGGGLLGKSIGNMGQERYRQKVRDDIERHAGRA